MSVDASTATGRAYAWARNAILDGRLATGTLVSEGEVAEAVGVSRTPVREAFLRLQSDGMLRLYPKRGALVVPVTAEEVVEVIDARALVEPWAFARVAAGTEAASVAARLLAWIATQAGCWERGDGPGFQDADRRFHEEVLTAAGNDLVLRFYATLRDRQVRLGAVATRANADRAAQILEEHAAIAAAVAAGDASTAADLVGAHVAATGSALGAGHRAGTRAAAGVLPGSAPADRRS